MTRGVTSELALFSIGPVSQLAWLTVCPKQKPGRIRKTVLLQLVPSYNNDRYKALAKSQLEIPLY